MYLYILIHSWGWHCLDQCYCPVQEWFNQKNDSFGWTNCTGTLTEKICPFQSAAVNCCGWTWLVGSFLAKSNESIDTNSSLKKIVLSTLSLDLAITQISDKSSDFFCCYLILSGVLETDLRAQIVVLFLFSSRGCCCEPCPTLKSLHWTSALKRTEINEL